MRVLPLNLLLLITAINVLSCGGGNNNSTKTPQTPTSQFYLPLAVGNTWSYDCGNQVTIADTVTQTMTINGQQTFALELQFPNAATQTYLLANDAQGNTTLYGYLVNGTVAPISPSLYISANPNQTLNFNYQSQDGGTVQRVFVNFEPTNPTPLGVFQVASYNENGKEHIWGYSAGNGVMEQDHGSFDCKITSFHLH